MIESTREKLLRQFREAAQERLGKISQGLMALEGAVDPDVSKATLRELHGLKGEARMMGFSEISGLIHEMEELVRSSDKGKRPLEGGAADALLVAVDAVSALAGLSAPDRPPEVQKIVDWLKQQSGTARAAGPSEALPPPPSPKDTAAAEPAQVASEAGPSARVSERKHDGSVRVSGEALEALTTAVTGLNQAARLRQTLSVRRARWAHEVGLLAWEAERLGPSGSQLAARLVKLREEALETQREARLLLNHESKDLAGLSDQVQEISSIPVATLFEPYPRMVRDLAKELGKEVELEVDAQETKADRKVLESLRDALMHLVRNSLDHGIEPRDQRLAAGKGPKGKVGLFARREGERIVIRVEDDGAGLDPAAMRAAAVRKGIFNEAEAAALSDSQAQELVLLPGFTTRDAASDISGRGVGLDAVKSRAVGLGGEVVLDSRPGRGLAVEVRVPVSLTVAPLLVVAVGEERVCLPAASVQGALRVEREQIREVAGRGTLRVGENLYAFASLANLLLGAPLRGPQEGELALLVKAQETTVALGVDRVLDESVQPILPLKGLMKRFTYLSGATPTMEGGLALVLAASHVVSMAGNEKGLAVSPAVVSPKKQKKRVLVVDDSPLTRDLLSSLLESAGFEIASAADGVEAADLLARHPVDLVLTDLEMPRMDGLELTRHVKSDAKLRSLPVVIITSRGSDADRRRGMEAGADGYVAKGDLVRQDLVDVVARLVR